MSSRRLADAWPALALALPLAAEARAAAGLPLDRLIQIIPDDAFYYLVLARHAAEGAGWCFDHQAPASGFHPLYAYLLAALDRFAPGLALEALAGIIQWSAAALALAGFSLLLAAQPARRRPALAAGLALVLATPLARLQLVMLMETPLVIGAGCALLAAIAAGRRRGAFAASLVGSLARMDFGVLPAALLGAALLLRARGRDDRDRRAAALAALAGALAGLGLVALHSLAIGGSLLPASLAVKRHWGELHGYDPMPALALLGGLWQPLAPAPAALAAIAILVAAAALPALLTGTTRPDGSEVATLGACLAVPGYALLYGADALGVQPWYFGNLVVPLGLAAGALVARLPARLDVALLAGATGLATAGALVPPAPLWPSQLASMAAGRMLRADPALAPVGAWNSGIIAWFAGRDVVNLDGLVNDEIRPFILADRAADYLDRRGIRHVVDFASTVTFEPFQRLHGMSCGRLTRRLEPVRTVSDDPRLAWDGTAMTLYRVLPAPPPYRPGEPIRFGRDGDALRFAGCGWAAPAAEGTRIAGPQAELILQLAAPAEEPVLTLDLAAGRPTGLAAEIDGRTVARWRLGDGVAQLSAALPRGLDRTLSLTLVPDDPGAAVQIRRLALEPR